MSRQCQYIWYTFIDNIWTKHQSAAMQPAAKSTGPVHPMRLVAARTGLTPDLLRAWEKRYGAVAPVRSSGGQRLYSDADVERLSLLARAVEGGRAIGQIANLPLDELQGIVERDARAR